MIYLRNGKIEVENEAFSLSPTDPGLLHGDGLFETVRVENRVPLFFAEHLKRLQESADFLSLPFPTLLSEPQVSDDLQRLLDETELSDAALRIVLTRGVETKGGEESPVVFMTVSPIPPELTGPELPILKLKTWRRCEHPGPPLGSHKFLGRLVYLLARKDVQREGADEAILLDRRGHLAEGSSFNLFWVKDGILFTPPLDMGILEGVTRSAVLLAASEESIPCQEVRSHLVAILGADEVFMTSSVREILPVSEVDEMKPRAGAPGPITRRLVKRYQSGKVCRT